MQKKKERNRPCPTPQHDPSLNFIEVLCQEETDALGYMTSCTCTKMVSFVLAALPYLSSLMFMFSWWASAWDLAWLFLAFLLIFQGFFRAREVSKILDVCEGFLGVLEKPKERRTDFSSFIGIFASTSDMFHLKCSVFEMWKRPFGNGESRVPRIPTEEGKSGAREPPQF